MPIYEYSCPECKTEIAIRQLEYEDKKPTCEKCAARMTKKFSTYSFQFDARMRSLEVLE